jgi:hypothetical protein
VIVAQQRLSNVYVDLGCNLPSSRWHHQLWSSAYLCFKGATVSDLDSFLFFLSFFFFPPSAPPPSPPAVEDFRLV